MFCENCGTQLQTDDIYCQTCGEKVVSSHETLQTHTSLVNEKAETINQQLFSNQETQKDQSTDNDSAYKNAQFTSELENPYHPSKNKKLCKRKKVIVGTISGVAVAAALTGGIIAYNIYTSPKHQAARLIKNEKYDEALKIYKNSNNEPAVADKITISLIEKLDSIKKNYINKKINYDDAKNQLKEIEQFEFQDVQTELHNTSEYIETMNKSFVAYEKGIAAFSEENYYEAMNCLKNVIADDPDYDDALQTLNEATTLYIETVIKEVEKLASSQNYSEAISKTQIALNEISSFAQKDSQKPLEDIINKYKPLFVDDVMKRAKEAKANENHTLAITILEEALDIVSDDSLKAELATIEAERPIPLAEMKLSESANYTQITDLTVTQDVVGNNYSPNNLFQISARADGWGSGYEGYADYYLSRKYRRLTGTIAVADISDTTNATLTIYADKTIIFTSNTLNRTTPPEEIDIDLTDVDWLEFKLTTDADAPDGTLYVLLSDLLFKK